MLGRVTGLLNMQMGHVGIELSAEHRIWTEPIEFFYSDNLVHMLLIIVRLHFASITVATGE